MIIIKKIVFIATFIWFCVSLYQIKAPNPKIQNKLIPVSVALFVLTCLLNIK